MTDRFRVGFRLGTMTLVIGLLAGNPWVAAQDRAATSSAGQNAETRADGQRVFSAGHSFHVFVPGILNDMAKTAGIKDHVQVGLSSIGGSRVIQHWDVADDKNKAKEALQTGKVDVLTLSPIHLPDEGIENFTKLALEHNPKIRVTVQEFWLPFDIYDTTFKLRPAKVDHNAPTVEELRNLHAPYFKGMDEHVTELNKKFGTTVLYVVPVGQAVIALREKISAGEAPGLKQQEDLFSDAIGHAKPPLQALVAYCHYAVIYKRSPVGLPMPAVLASAKNPDWDERLNRLLQELAWAAVTQHPLSGVKREDKPSSRNCSAVSPDGDAAEWPQFLGPQRNGISTETGLLESWPAGGPKEVWRAKGGVGMSGLAISRGRLVTMVQNDGKQWLVAMNAQTGESIWRTAIAPEYRNQMGNGPRGTPAISGDRVFTFSGEGILAAVNFDDGKVLWSHDVVEELHGKTAEYGMACSPLVVGDQVIVTAGAPQATVVAYDAKSGKLAWTAGDGVAGYSSPALLDVGGRPQIVVHAGSAVLGLATQKGTVLWSYPYETNFDCNIATPLAHKGRVFISSGENHGSVLLAPKPSGDQFEVLEVWASQGPKSVMRNEWQTSMLLDGYLYGMDNVGGAGPITHLTCVKADSGERVWQKARFGKGNLIAADGKLFISTMNGELVVVRATPKSYDEIGRSVVIGSTRQAPALAGGLLYLRDDAEIVCLEVQKR